MDYIMKKYEDKIILISAHRFSTIESVDEILVIENGRIVERGSHQNLLDLGGKYYELYEVGRRINHE